MAKMEVRAMNSSWNASACWLARSTSGGPSLEVVPKRVVLRSVAVNHAFLRRASADRGNDQTRMKPLAASASKAHCSPCTAACW